MNKIWKYIALGFLVSFAGILFADIVASFFNGLDYGSACTLAMGMYLCAVIVTCTGIILSKLPRKNDDSKEES